MAANEKPNSAKGLDKHWHMATTDKEVAFTELEFALLRVSAAFDRWQRDCLACCIDGFSATDGAMLNVIRMHERPKSISEIARLLNRDDSSNLQYNIRKLQDAGLIEKAGKSDSKKGVTYQVTEEGKRVTDQYVRYRRELLLGLLDSFGDIWTRLDDVSHPLNLIAGLYDQASCVAATHRV